MRIFGGTAKGRVLYGPKGVELRPTTDKVRLALFNAIGGLVPGSRFLDLCCGSGAVGIEALSRGAEHVVFVDSNRRCIDAVRETLKTFGFEEGGWELMPSDAQRGLTRLQGGKPFDLVYVDPPYDAALGKPLLQGLVSAGILKQDPNTRVILEHAADQKSPEVEGLSRFRHYDHGAAALSVYGLEAYADAH
jgi:16S rRNA (guanine(966)-N(2))-methyltransferase RsmD